MTSDRARGNDSGPNRKKAFAKKPFRGGRPQDRRASKPSDAAPGAAPSQSGSSAPTSRSVAIEILGRLEESTSARASEVLGECAGRSRLSARDIRFASELVHGVLRRRLTLDCVVAAYARRALLEMDRTCLQALRIGVYQLLFLDAVPPFAAVSETLRALANEHEGVRSAVNGTLRTIDREANRMTIDRDRGGSSIRRRMQIGDRKVVYFPRDVFCDPNDSLELYLGQTESHPPPLVGRWLRRFDREVAEAILAANNGKPMQTARVNRLKAERSVVLARLKDENVLAGEGKRADSILFGSPIDEVAASATFRDGCFYLQDETAMGVAEVVAPQPNERILDLCAAPGGKSTHLFELGRGEAVVVCNDRDPSRLHRLRENIARLGHAGIEVTALDPLTGDAREFPSLAEPFDAVLVDAPCSNTGVLRRRPEARWRVDATAISDLAEQARALLDFAASRVKPGGRIVYSTCSIEHEENTENAQRFLVAHPGFSLDFEQQVLPRVDGPDGGYVAKFVRTPSE